jgi:hypothetical protein
MDRNDSFDFMLWFRANEEENPNDFVSLHPRTPRARQWCEEHIEDSSVVFRDLRPQDMTNDEAWELRHHLEAKGFRVMGVS